MSKSFNYFIIYNVKVFGVFHIYIYFGEFNDDDDLKWPSSADWDRMNIDERIKCVSWRQ